MEQNSWWKQTSLAGNLIAFESVSTMLVASNVADIQYKAQFSSLYQDVIKDNVFCKNERFLSFLGYCQISSQ
jgi:hypothetical protein